jgi:PadR family transcriptional regulator PadR
MPPGFASLMQGDWRGLQATLSLSLRYEMRRIDRTSDDVSSASAMICFVALWQQQDLEQGTLDLLVLRTLLWGPAHGHAIAKAIQFRSGEVLQVEHGSLYPALHRLIKRRWVSVEAGTSENNRKAKFYRLTPKGRQQLELQTSKWDELAAAIARILRPTEGERES